MVKCLVSMRYLPYFFFSKIGRDTIWFTDVCRHACWRDFTSDSFFCMGCLLIVLALGEEHFFFPVVWRKWVKGFFSQSSAFTLCNPTVNRGNSLLGAQHSQVSQGCHMWQAHEQLTRAATTLHVYIDRDQILCIPHLVAEK